MSEHPQEDIIIKAEHISNRFGKQVIHDDISFTIRRGEIIGIVGESGSGKSVLLKTLTGLRKPNHGKVSLAGKPLNKMAAKKRASIFGVLFQEGALFSSLTVAQNIAFPLNEHTKLTKTDRAQLAAFKLALVGLGAEVGAKYPSELSGGMTKRASLARALALDPPILFLDEPTAGLDPVSATQFDEMIVMLNQTLGVTIVMVTHDLDTLFTICTRVAVLVDQKLIIDPLDVLLDNPHPWIREYLHGPRAYGARQAHRKRWNMENERHYFLVGLFVLGGVLAVFIFTIWLTAQDDSQYRQYRIHFAESVSGLSNGSDVKFRGVKVGNVKSIIIDPKDSRLIEVDIMLLKSTPVKAETTANLKLQGITGVVFIELSGGNPSEPNVVNKDSDTDIIPEIPAQQSSLNALIDRVPILLDKISASFDRFNKLLSDDNISAASDMMKNGDATMSQLHSIVGGSQKDINDSTHSAASAMRHLNKASGQLENLSEDPSAILFPPDEKGIPAP